MTTSVPPPPGLPAKVVSELLQGERHAAGGKVPSGTAAYLASPELRREIHGGLQVVENGNSANTVLRCGKDGALTGPDKEHAETCMLALHLLQSSLVHVSTLLLQQVLSEST